MPCTMEISGYMKKISADNSILMQLGPSGCNGNGAPQERGLGGEKGEGGCCAPAHYGGGGGGYYSSGAGDGTEGANGYSLRSVFLCQYRHWHRRILMLCNPSM